MCAFQARYYAYYGTYFAWPDNSAGDPAPDYPEGFYQGDLVTDFSIIQTVINGMSSELFTSTSTFWRDPDTLATHYISGNTIEGMTAQGVADTLVHYAHRVSRTVLQNANHLKKLALIQTRLGQMNTLIVRAKAYRIELKRSIRYYYNTPFAAALAAYKIDFAALPILSTDSTHPNGFTSYNTSMETVNRVGTAPNFGYQCAAVHVRFLFDQAKGVVPETPGAARFFGNTVLSTVAETLQGDIDDFLARSNTVADGRYHELSEPVIETGGTVMEHRTGYTPSGGRVGVPPFILTVTDYPPYRIGASRNNSSGPQFFLIPLKAIVPGAKDVGSSGEALARCIKGSAGGSIGSARYNISLGRDRVAGVTAALNFHIEFPSADALTPDALTLSGDSDSEVLRDATGTLSQFVAGGSLVTVDLLDPLLPGLGYRLKGYHRDHTATKGVNGLYPLPAGPTVFEIEFGNDDTTAASFDAFTITRSFGTHSDVDSFAYTAASDKWAQTHAGGHRINTVANLRDAANGLRTETRTAEDAGGALISRVVSEYEMLGAGERLTSQTVDPTILDNGGQVIHQGRDLTTTFEFEDGTTQPSWKGELIGIETPTGAWTRYEYDNARRIVKSVSGHGDVDNTAPENQCRVVNITYTDTTLTSVKETVVTLLGEEISRTWRKDYSRDAANNVAFGDYDLITAVTPGASVGDASNLVTEYRVARSGSFAGRIASTTAPDGTLTLFEHSMNGATFATSNTQTTTVSTGAPSGGAISDGIRTVTVTNREGTVTSSTATDIATGKALSSDTATATDAFGRPTAVAHLDGTTTTTNYDCCGIANTTDRAGIYTGFDNTDDLVSAQTRLDIRTTTAQSELARSGGGRIETLTRTAVDGGGNVISGTGTQLTRREYNTAGDLVAEYAPPVNATTDPAPADLAARRLTTHAESIDASGHTLRTITNPDGTTIVTESYQDGSLAKISGTGTHGRRYIYGVEPPGDGTPARRYTQEILLDNAGADSGEWSKTYTDMLGRLSHIVTSAGATTTRAYNSLGQLASVSDPDSVTSLFAYDARGRLEFRAIDDDANGSIDAGGTDPLTKTTTTVASRNGIDIVRTTTEIYTTDGAATATEISRFETSTDGLQTWSTTDSLVTHTQTIYSGSGNYATTTTYPDNTERERLFFAGRLASDTLSDNNGTQITSTTYSYDDLGRNDQLTDARNGTTSLAYYIDGRLKTTTSPDPDGPGPESTKVTALTYDSAGRRDILTLPDAQTVDYDYFPTGELQQLSGARTYTTGYTYDHTGRMKTLHAGSGTTTWNYDAASGFLGSKLHDDGKGPSYTYTPAGRPLTRTLARGLHRKFTYTTDGSQNATSYYTDNTEASADPATPSVAYTYDRAGRLETLTDAAGLHTYTRAPTGRVELETITGGPLDGASFDPTYDALLRRQQLTFGTAASALTHSYRYDTAGRYQKIATGPDPTTSASATYTYHADSHLPHTTLSKDPTGATKLTLTRGFDNIGRLTAISNVSTSTTAPLDSSFIFVHNAAGQREKITLADGSYWDYTYDALGQLTTATKRLANGTAIDSQTFGFSFDNIGNRLTSTQGGASPPTSSYTANALNQYTAIADPGKVWITGAADPTAAVTIDNAPAARPGAGNYFEHLADGRTTPATPTEANRAAFEIAATLGPDTESVTRRKRVPPATHTPSHDDDGNLLADAFYDYTWDGENRLLSVETKSTLPPEFPRARLEFAYDAGSRRVAKEVFAQIGGTWISARSLVFLYDGWNLLAEYDASDRTVEKSYLWGADLSGTLGGAGGTAGLLHLTDHRSGDGDKGYFVAYDGKGNATALVDATTGDLAAEYSYAPFGGDLGATGPAAALNPFRFSTRYLDTETGHYYYGYRYLDTASGRWLSRDPIGENGGLNLYGMVGNDAVNGVDVLGLVDFESASLNDVQLVRYSESQAEPYVIAISDSGDWAVYSPKSGKTHRIDDPEIQSRILEVPVEIALAEALLRLRSEEGIAGMNDLLDPIMIAGLDAQERCKHVRENLAETLEEALDEATSMLTDAALWELAGFGIIKIIDKAGDLRDLKKFADAPKTTVFQTGVNITPRSVANNYRTIGRGGRTFVTESSAVEGILGPLKGNRISITGQQARQLENALGLNPNSLEARNILSIIDNVPGRVPRVPTSGNSLFQGAGAGLPGGGAELTIQGIPSAGGQGIRQIILEVIK